MFRAWPVFDALHISLKSWDATISTSEHNEFDHPLSRGAKPAHGADLLPKAHVE